MKLICAFVDVCLPDYWGGHHLPHVAVPVNRDTTFANLRSMIAHGLRAGAVAGADATPKDTYENDEWYEAAREAVERDVRSNYRTGEYPFRDLYSDADETSGTAYAYFVFFRED